jgi:hypothetical protein
VTLWYDPPGNAGTWTSKAMSRISGTIYSGTWRTTVTGFDSWSGAMYYYTIGRDYPGNTRQYPILAWPILIYPSVNWFTCPH